MSAVKISSPFSLGFFIFPDTLTLIKTLNLVAEEKTASYSAKSNGSWLTLKFSLLPKFYFISIGNTGSRFCIIIKGEYGVEK